MGQILPRMDSVHPVCNFCIRALKFKVILLGWNRKGKEKRELVSLSMTPWKFGLYFVSGLYLKQITMALLMTGILILEAFKQLMKFFAKETERHAETYRCSIFLTESGANFFTSLIVEESFLVK